MKNILVSLLKINRVVVWFLLLGLLLFFVSGFGMTRGFIDYRTASYLHFQILPWVVGLSFLYHATWQVHTELKRWRVWNSITKVLLMVISIALLVGFVYLKELYLKPDEATHTTPISASTSETIFTAETLSQFDGQNGQPAYVAVDGVVYNATEAFPGGNHHGHTAGQDLSREFHDQHIMEILDGLTVVGIYEE